MKQRRLVVVLTLIVLALAPGLAAAQVGPRLVCFERSDLVASLDRVANVQQFLRNDQLLRRASCDFASIPSGSAARFAGFHRAAGGFVFPLYDLRYATTGQRMVAADGIFRGADWVVTNRCGRGALGGPCLVPRDCAVLDGFVTAGGVPSYVAVPARCEVLRTL